METYLGHIILFAGNYAPDGWLPCNGQILQVSQYVALASLLGKTYGGDGSTTFGLPDLRGRVPVGLGAATAATSQRTLGQTPGEEQVTLAVGQMPAHSHGVQATTNLANTNVPSGALLAAVPAGDVFYLDPPNPVPADVTIETVPLAATAVASAFNGGAHTNIMPSRVMNYIICVQGLYPTPS
jgi:microcystin-dependent protein